MIGDAGRGKAAYVWISPGPAKTGPTLGGVVVIINWMIGTLP